MGSWQRRWLNMAACRRYSTLQPDYVALGWREDRRERGRTQNQNTQENRPKPSNQQKQRLPENTQPARQTDSRLSQTQSPNRSENSANQRAAVPPSSLHRGSTEKRQQEAGRHLSAGIKHLRRKHQTLPLRLQRTLKWWSDSETHITAFTHSVDTLLSLCSFSVSLESCFVSLWLCCIHLCLFCVSLSSFTVSSIVIVQMQSEPTNQTN